jgi:hypothetical protein
VGQQVVDIVISLALIQGSEFVCPLGNNITHRLQLGNFTALRCMAFTDMPATDDRKLVIHCWQSNKYAIVKPNMKKNVALNTALASFFYTLYFQTKTTNMTDVLNQYDQPAPKRPTFLTVICILTFIGSGYGVISNIWGYVSADKTAEAMERVRDMQHTSNDEGAKMAQRMMEGFTNVFTPGNLRIAALAGLAAAVLCLIGALMMWNLKKPGFYAYVLGTLVGLAIPLYLFGGNIFGILGTAVAGIFGIAFCIMYGVNLKHMK